ncbi:MAG TPA: hypothetical protein VLT36_10305, partial [Candidatus Dormibacteraeota bacterium]|nr:hypothetical protein [Candidatus Dormibacteraeota bacterium]
MTNDKHSGPTWVEPSKLLFWLGAAIVVIALLLVVVSRRMAEPDSLGSSGPAQFASEGAPRHLTNTSTRLRSGPTLAGFGDSSAEEIVARKLSQFADNRQTLLNSWAKLKNIQVPPEVERFFAAVKNGNWDEIKTAFEALNQIRKNPQTAEQVSPVWPVILETFGVAESTHDWPAQKLLDYGNTVLGALRPGMAYIGGTDPGRFIPTFLNETGDGEHRIVITQNAMADNTYLEYLKFLYGDRMKALTGEDSQKAFQEYLSGAQSRLLHDQQSPDEPKQIHPGEEVQTTDGRVQVSGQVAVMLINELLLQKLMDKNPDLSFGLEESFPLKSTYTNAAPLGPLMELRVQDEQNRLTTESASATLDYWRGLGQQVLADT